MRKKCPKNKNCPKQPYGAPELNGKNLCTGCDKVAIDKKHQKHRKKKK